VSRRRVRGIVRKELREIRHNRSLLAGMAVLPLLFLVQPLVAVFALPAASAGSVRHAHELVYMLGIPALMPALLAAYAVVGERRQGTLEPVLTTPIRREELLLGKAVAVLVPAVAVAYVVFGLFVAAVALFAAPGVAPALLRGPDVAVQLALTPLVTGWSTWLAMAISTRLGDIRVAQQLSLLASLPTVVVAALVAFGVIPATAGVALAGGAALAVLNALGRRMVAAAFDRERLIAHV
jgi:ABC-type transport system involved in multi-copper enzyme maturation permease subunit